jgi:hypothetical protein
VLYASFLKKFILLFIKLTLSRLYFCRPTICQIRILHSLSSIYTNYCSKFKSQSVFGTFDSSHALKPVSALTKAKNLGKYMFLTATVDRKLQFSLFRCGKKENREFTYISNFVRFLNTITWLMLNISETD